MHWIGVVPQEVANNTFLQVGICLQLAALSEPSDNLAMADDQLAGVLYSMAMYHAREQETDVELYTATVTLKCLANGRYKPHLPDGADLSEHIYGRVQWLTDFFPLFQVGHCPI